LLLIYNIILYFNPLGNAVRNVCTENLMNSNLHLLNQEAWTYAKNTLRLEGLEPSEHLQAAAELVLSGKLTWSEVIERLQANGWRSFP
jgi:hypothetical protein